MNYDELRTWAYELEAENLRLKADNKRLREGGCRFNCRSQKEAFEAGYKAGFKDNSRGDGIPEWIYRYEQWRASK